MLRLQSIAEAVPLLSAEDEVVLGLPLAAVLAQRFRLPTSDASEFPEMVRIQMEKALPFSPDEVTTDFEVIHQNGNESVISAVAVRNEQLADIAGPLLERGLIPQQVTVYAAQRASTYAPHGNALLIYPEGETLVSAVTENGKVSLTRTLDGGAPEQLRSELPQLALSAELQGISSSFPNVLLDETCYEMRDTIEQIVPGSTNIVGLETPPAAVKLNLLPESWRQRRTHLARRGELRKRLLWASGAYGGIFALLLVYLIAMRATIGYFNSAIARDAPKTQFVRGTEANWKAVAPAIDARYYAVEILLHLFESLPSNDVRITTYNQSARQISVEGEANSPALAYQFVEKIKKNSGLRIFQFDMSAPRILANNHAQFRIEGRPR
ncbi:MAG TPA: pilus assembly protein PilM [Chthoniobacterales bacterium]|nr:pilus assembly protein PilM [Chthoniobacterales bacterium]